MTTCICSYRLKFPIFGRHELYKDIIVVILGRSVTCIWFDYDTLFSS